MILILCTRLLEFVTLITLIASFLPWHAPLILKISFYITGKSHCYSLGMVKIEAFDESYFMHQTIRVCHTDHPDSIVSSMACIVHTHTNKHTLSLCVDSWNIRVSICAARRLFAAVMAWMSPVRCRLNSSMGITWE